MKQQQWYVYEILNSLFITKGYHQLGTLMAEPDVMLTGIQMRRPDIAYLTKEQIRQGRINQEYVISEFVIEIIATNDTVGEVENKLNEYFKAGVRVVWLIFIEEQAIEIYTSRRNLTICLENDICSASPGLPDFEISLTQTHHLARMASTGSMREAINAGTMPDKMPTKLDKPKPQTTFLAVSTISRSPNLINESR
jgi:Uma2 family endonuclease